MDEPYGAKFFKNYSPQLVQSESDDDESELSDDEAQQLKDNIFLVNQRQCTCTNESRELFQSRRFEKDANATEDFCGFEKFVFKNFANFMKIETSGVLDFTVFAAGWNRDLKELAPDFGTGVFCKLCFFIKHSLLLSLSVEYAVSPKTARAMMLHYKHVETNRYIRDSLDPVKD